MAPRIGVYDSGIGGLTTLALLQAKLPSCTYVYLADTARMPFGSKSRAEIYEAAENAMKILRAGADVIVFGCNTASVTAEPDGAFKLRPALAECDPQKTLVLATPRTLAGLDAKARGFMCADTPELAVLTEIQISLRYKSRTVLSCAPLSDYIRAKLSPFAHKAEKVLLGCSHYVYAEKEIRAVLGNADYSDGNDALTDSVRAALQPELSASAPPDGGVPPTDFVFTGAGERDKYMWILGRLHREYVPRFVAADRLLRQRTDTSAKPPDGINTKT